MVNIDPTMSVVVFELLLDGELQKFSRPGVASATDTVKLAWGQLADEVGAKPSQVRRIYAEWEPAEEDQAFLSSTFPGLAP